MPSPDSVGSLDLSPARPSAAFFRAAADLHRAAPWRFFPGNDDLIGFSAAALGVTNAVLSIIGQDDEAFGVILFYSIDAFEQYAGASLERGAGGADAVALEKLPEHLGLTFDGAREVDPELRKLVKARGWDLASDRAYPSVLSANEGGERRTTTAHEQRIMTVVADGLVRFLRDRSALRRAFRTGEEQTTELDVETAEGPVTLVLRVPVEAAAEDEAPDDDAAETGAITAADVTDPETAMEHGVQLIEVFATAPEAEPFFEVESLGTLVMLAWDHFGATPSTLTPEALRTLLRLHYPRDIAAPPDLAPELVQVLRAFFAFLLRAYEAPHASACGEMLDDEAARSLWQGLADRSLWSREKAEMMIGVRLAPLPPRPKRALTQAEKNKAKARRRGD